MKGIIKNKTILLTGVVLLVLFHLFLASWYVIHGDLRFISDIARDFFIYDEIKQKIIIFIGGRTSSNLYHGPLWWYITYPAYLIGNGNPLVVGWYWIGLISLSLVSAFYAAKNIFNTTVACLYIIMLSLTYVIYSSSLINPHGAMLIMPLFFYFFIKYIRTLRLKYLILELITIGAMIQFEMAVGIPMLLLSFPIILFHAFHDHKKRHLFAYFIILLSVGNYFIFDLRHQFLIFKQVVSFITPRLPAHSITYPEIIKDRIRNFLWGYNLLNAGGNYLNMAITVLSGIFIFLQIKQNKYQDIYLYFVYFFVGFYVLSFINKGDLLSYYLYPLLPLILLIFCSFITSRYKLVFLGLFALIYISNLNTTLAQLKVDTQNYIGKDKQSWKFLYEISSRIFKEGDKDLGYYVYAPDAIGYSPRYALEYAAKNYPNVTSHAFQKRHVTYVLVEPPAANNPYLSVQWWFINKLHINKKPVETIKYDNGYKLEKFILTDDEVMIPSDPTIDIGLHYR